MNTPEVFTVPMELAAIGRCLSLLQAVTPPSDLYTQKQIDLAWNEMVKHTAFLDEKSKSSPESIQRYNENLNKILDEAKKLLKE